MIRLVEKGAYLLQGKAVLEVQADNQFYNSKGQRVNPDELPIDLSKLEKSSARQNTLSYPILMKHNTAEGDQQLKIRFDALTSHDITYVGIVQTARASGLEEFPIPYVLTNCHNSLCAVGGTINEDDHRFGLSAAQKYGGIYVPKHQAVLHQYMRETMARPGNMILGSDSHTRYGALGTMAIGEGGPELVKQLLEKTYDIAYPEIIAVYLEGKPRPGVGPQDVALSLIGAVFKKGFVKNKILEFVGPGIGNLSVDYRNGIDTMTTETTCLSSIWATDHRVKEYYQLHGRGDQYETLEPGEVAYYDGMVMIDLSQIEPMIALPFHPSNAYAISELNQNPLDILREIEKEAQKQLDNPNLQFSLTQKLMNGKLKVDQAVVAGCAGGTFENLMAVASIVENRSVGDGALSFSVYPASQPIYLELLKNGAAAKLVSAGVILQTAFCGPCFGAGDIPANGDLSIRHTTRNFPNREGSKPGDGQISSVALMDARSIAATAVNGGILTPATELEQELSESIPAYQFGEEIYAKRVYQGFRQAQLDEALKFGPNIADWPKMVALPENLLLKVASVILDPVTTTDELIPSGETSSYRSNPLKLAEFALSRKDPNYVERAKTIQALEMEREQLIGGGTLQGNGSDLNLTDELRAVCEMVLNVANGADFISYTDFLSSTGLGSVLYAKKPGDGSAREQAASSQKVLGGWANIAGEYATKRYRSNLINWGMLPFTMDSTEEEPFNVNDFVFIPGIRNHVEKGEESLTAQVITSSGIRPIRLALKNLTQDERDIILKGCLINYYTVK